jgi:hypothetical protein
LILSRVAPHAMTSRTLARVENAKTILDRASARFREEKGGASLGRGLGRSDGKENVDDSATKPRGDGVLTPPVDDERKPFDGLRIELEDVDANKAGGERAAGDVVGALMTDEMFDACVGNVVCDWFSDGDSITAEGDKVLGICLQSLYAPLRGDETLEALRIDKSALTRGDKATKEDKKHLRPLYVRLAKIKDLIAIREAGG